jgi:transposase-like protein
MKIRKLDQTLCPVCQSGHIAPAKLDNQMMFCPVCRSRSLREEKRKRFGLAIDRWWVCPGCSAEFDVVLGGRAKLVSAGADPLGVGKNYVGETLPVTSWQQLAPLSEAVWTCDRCAAQFYELGDSRLSLDWVERDPHGAKGKLLGKTYYRTVWIKLANGLSANVGNTHCPACNATFDYDQVDKRLKLLECDRARFPRAVPLIGQLHGLDMWSLFAAGKNSLSAGWLCSSCLAEFDKDGTKLGFVGGPARYNTWVGESRSFEDWHRRARNLPSEQDEAELKRELGLLQAEKQKDLAHLNKAEQERRAGIEKQIQELLKQSFIGGFIGPAFQTTSIGLKKNERVLWETAAFRLKQRSSDGVPFWAGDGVGIIVVTDQRVIFRADTGAVWSKPVSKLLSVNHEYIRDHGVCVLWFDGQQKPVAFGGVDTTGTPSIGGTTFPIQLTSHDLREILQSRCGG